MSRASTQGRSLTAKQQAALRAVAGDQRTGQSIAWWAEARISWPGPRKTLGSLLYRGLVNYTHEDFWTITDEGRQALAELDA